MSPAQILAILLALSVAGNAALGWAYLGARDARVEATGERDQARSAAMACSVHTDELYQEQERLAAAVKVAQAAAARAAAGHEGRAQQILAAPASAPGDDCKSARDRAIDWLRSRTAP